MKISRKKTLAFGALLLVIGFIFSLSYTYSERKSYIDYTVFFPPFYQSVNSYNVTGFFNEGEALLWDPPNLRASPPPIFVPFNATLIAPNGSKVVFKVEFIGEQYVSLEYNYTLLKNEGALIVEEGVVGGFVTSTGNYTLILDQAARNLYGNPPPYLRLVRGMEIWVTLYPYRDRLFPAGLALVVIGSGFSLWAFKPKRTILARKEQKSEK
jgi:hypothetical protein